MNNGSLVILPETDFEKSFLEEFIVPTQEHPANFEVEAGGTKKHWGGKPYLKVSSKQPYIAKKEVINAPK